MAETARRKHSHMLCFKCVEEADVTFSKLAMARGMSKGDLFVEMLKDYTDRKIADDDIFFAERKTLQQELIELVDKTDEANQKAKLKLGRPSGADGAATEPETAGPVA